MAALGEEEYGICLSDIISLDGESGPPTLAGTPPCGPSLAPGQGKQRSKRWQQQQQQQQEWKQQQEGSGPSPRQRGGAAPAPHDRGAMYARKQAPPQQQQQQQQSQYTGSPASPGYASNYSGSSFSGNRRPQPGQKGGKAGKKGGNDNFARRDRYVEDSTGTSPPGQGHHYDVGSASLTNLSLASLASLDKSNDRMNSTAPNVVIAAAAAAAAAGEKGGGRRSRRPASWGGHSANWRGSYGSDKAVAIITCAGCNVQIPANQAVGHASQCNRLQGQNKKAGSGAAQSPQASPRRSMKGGKDTFTSAYSLFIAKELEGVKMKRDDVTSSKWKEMSPAEKYQDLANRNRSMKETLLHRMTAATAKWEGMNNDLRKPFMEEAAKNKEREQSEIQQFEQQQQMEKDKEKERARREAKKKEHIKSVSFEESPPSNRASVDPEELARWTKQALGGGDDQQLISANAADSSAMHIAQLALYLADIGVVPAPVFAGSPDGSMQNVCHAPHDSSTMSLPTTYTSARDENATTSRTPSGGEDREWDVASATDSAPSTPPSPTYACATITLQNANPASLRALLDYETSDEEKEDSDTDEEIVSHMVTGHQPE